jgi:hypothetical protein
MATKKTTGSGKKPASPQKPLNQPIPINSGISSVHTDSAPRAQEDSGIEEEIRIRAYELYLERGRVDGFHNEDWVLAEEEVLSRRNRERSA